MGNEARRGVARAGHGVERKASAIAALCVAAFLGGCSGKTDGAPARAPRMTGAVKLTAAQHEHIRLYTVEPSTFHKIIEATGSVDFDNERATSVVAPFSGSVSRLAVSLGERVQKGDPLAAVDSPDFAAAIGTYHKALATAKTNRRLADLDKDLVQHNGVSLREAAQAETDAANAEADRDAALQTLVSLHVPAKTLRDLEDGRAIVRPQGIIRAPIAGTVVEKWITPGELLQAGVTPCFTVADMSRVWVMARIFGSDLAALSVGDTADVQTGDSRTFSGRLENIAALVDPDTRSVAARVVVDNPQEFLKKQMYVRVLIKAARESVGLLAPVSSILRDDENLPFDYVVQADGSFARQHVTLGDRTGDRYAIAAGLRGGEQIVADGGLFVQFMQNQ